MDECELIRMEHIYKAFSGVNVIRDVELVLYPGEVLGLVGENGAGKSTLMNLLTGVYSIDKGIVYYKGEVFKPQNSLEAQIKGISFIHQELDLFENLSVLENMFIERIPTRYKIFKDKKKMRAIANMAISRIGGGLDINMLVGNLEMGKRQMLEIVKAVSKNSSVIIFDEPTTSLSTSEKGKLFEMIEELRKSGTSIIYISHNLEEIFKLCNRIMVMRDGKNVAVLNNKEISRDVLVKLMIGREVTNIFPYDDRKKGDIALEVNHVCREHIVNDVSFQTYHGEVFGIFGLMGAGRSELLRCIFGIDKSDRGEVIIAGKLIKKPLPTTCIRNGVAFLTENRSQEGLLLDKSVEENLVLTCLKELKGRFGILNKKHQSIMSANMISKLNIKSYNSRVQVARKLSGGNQQKIVVGKWLLTKPSVFIMDEPTKGIDVGTKAEIYKLINKLALDGNAIVMVSSEMEELMGVCDRILVMYRGSVSSIISRSEFSQERLLRLAFGVQGEKL